MPRVKQSARRSVSGSGASSCAAASWAPDSDDDLAGDAARVSRLDKAERGAMGVALAELSRALDAEDWSVALTVSESALTKWPRWRELRAAKERLAGYLAACASATSARRRPPPPTDLRLTDVDEESLPSARAARMPEHISRMGDVLPKIFQYLERTNPFLSLWTSKPYLDRLVQKSRNESTDDWLVDLWEDSGVGMRKTLTTEQCVENLVLYQTVRSVSKAWSYPLYGGIRQLVIDYGWCPHIPPEVGGRFVSVECVEFSQEFGAPYVPYDLPTALRHMPKLRSLRFWLDGHDGRVRQFPSWFAELQLVELYTGAAAGDVSWDTDDACLPRSLEFLDVVSHGENLSLTCIRRLPRLRELHTNDAVENWPAWLHEVTSLRRLHTGDEAGIDLDGCVDVLRRMSLEAITSTRDTWSDDEEAAGVPIEGYMDALERLVVGTPCGASLRELDIKGNQLSHVPDCFRGLRLQVLNVEECGLEAIPSWIAELPLVALDLAQNSSISTLPASLQTLTSLRVLVLRGTNLCGPQVECRDEEGNIWFGKSHERCVPVLWFLENGTGEACRYELDDDETLAEIVRRDAILRGLSLALPDLRMMLYWRTGDMLEINPAKDWWHARCGYDWIDPVFYTDPSSDEADGYYLTETDSLEAARARLRAARGET